MRIDFREERKWKTAVAYTLALAVQEWHEAGTTEERIRRGICVVWSKNFEEDIPLASNIEGSSAIPVDELPRHRSLSDSMHVAEESDDGSDEEEKDNAILADADTVEPGEIAELTQEPENMKVEDNFDFTTALQAAPTTEPQDQVGTGANSSRQDSREGSDPTPPGLRVTSENPMMSFANNGLSAATQGAMRERVAFMDLNKVFLDADDLGLANLISKPSTEEAPYYIPPNIDLVALFGDVQAYGLPEPVPAAIQLDIKKNRREREDVSRRLDEANATKLVPVSKFMFCRPTLISALQPSRHWRDETWTGLDESPVHPTDTPPFSQELACSEFAFAVISSLGVILNVGYRPIRAKWLQSSHHSTSYHRSQACARAAYRRPAVDTTRRPAPEEPCRDVWQ
jgi:chromatin modification-related protein VID21